MNTKLKKRHIIQAIVFIVAVAVTINHALVEAGGGISWLSAGYIHYVCPICGVTTIYQYFASAADWMTKLTNPVTIVLIVSIGVAVFAGPIFCGWICPFGAFQDFMAFVGRKINGKKYNTFVNPKVDKVLRWLRYVSLLTVIYMTANSMVTVLETVNPYHALLDLFTGEFAVIGLVVLAVIAVTSLFIHRPWCKYLCPYGAFLGIFNVFRVRAIVREPSTCVSCGRCSRTCPMNIDVANARVVRDHQCISCLECTSENACPKADTVKLSSTKGIVEKVKLGPVNIGAFIVALVSLVVITVNISMSSTSLDGYGFDTDIVKTLDGEFVDGVYTGTGTGFNTGLTVEVTVADNQVTNIEIVSHNETVGYYEEAFVIVPSEIVTDQTSLVDTVSGATRSSEGIIEAVEDALSQASVTGIYVGSVAEDVSVEPVEETSEVVVAGDNADPQSQELPADGEMPADSTGDNTGDNTEAQVEEAIIVEETSMEEQVTEEVVVEESAAEEPSTTGLYTDGIYSGSGYGYKSNISVDVTISDGVISDIEVTSEDETPQFFEKAIALLDSIINSQSTEVDTVSGATLSSNGLIEGVNEALDQAN